MRVGITGHRPNKLWGYDYNDRRWQYLKQYIKNRLLLLNCDKFYTGMALGVDMVSAQAVIELKEEGHNIDLVAIIPCAGQANKWPIESQKMYYEILTKADRIYGTADANPSNLIPLTLEGDFGTYKLMIIEYPGYEYRVSYNPGMMQKRNTLVVDNSDILLAVWNGCSGGTANCVNYARNTYTDIEIINPDFIK